MNTFKECLKIKRHQHKDYIYIYIYIQTQKHKSFRTKVYIGCDESLF